MSEGQQGPTLWQVIKSVLAAAFGVQSNANRERDFKHGKPGQFVIIALILTILFVLFIWGLVILAMSVVGV